MSIAAPILVYRSARVARSTAMPRNSNYLRNVVAWTVAPAVLLFKWHSMERPFEELGLAAGVLNASWLVLISTTIAVSAYFLITRTVWGQNRLLGPAFDRNSLHTPGMPEKPAEIPGFAILELAETVSDELIYRAFLWFYLQTFLGTVAAVLIMIAIYVGSEAYRGPAGMARAAVMALGNSALLLMSGAIWAGVAVQLGWRAARTTAVVSRW